MIKAILIDDEVHCLDTLSILITDFCPEVQVMEVCRSAKQGLYAVAKHQPAIIFLDIEMPVMNGFEFLEQIKRSILQSYLLPVTINMPSKPSGSAHWIIC